MRSMILGALAFSASLTAAPATAEPPAALASIKPVHSLLASVMEGVAEPELLLDGLASPHTYSLRPSDAVKLSQADLVVWVGPGIESFLDRTIANLAQNAETLELSTIDGLTRLSYRDGGLFEAHDHAEGAPADEHGHAEETEHAHDDPSGHATGSRGHGETDTHLWLDPANAKVMVEAIAERLAAVDPENADAYRANAAAQAEELDRLKTELREAAASVANEEGFVTFHDAFQYFERAFGIEAVASVTLRPEITPGARRVAELQARIADTGVRCLVSEPQFPSEMVELLSTEETRTAVLDPIGVAFDAGPQLYAQLMRANMEALVDCVGGRS